MENFKVGDKVRIREERITGMWIEGFKKRHPRKDGIHEVTAKLGMDLYVLDNDDKGGFLPCLFVGRWLQEAEKRSPKFKVGDMVRVLDGEDIDRYTHGWRMKNYIGYIFEIGRIEIFEDGRIGYWPKGDVLTYDERGLELVEGVKKDPKRAYITDEKKSEERETIPKAKIQKLLGDIGQMIVEYRKNDEGDKAEGMEIVAFALRMALKKGREEKNKTGVH